MNARFDSRFSDPAVTILSKWHNNGKRESHQNKFALEPFDALTIEMGLNFEALQC
jgi:hypothetical protein